MEQFRQIGEVIGSLKALMVFREEIHINQRQCCLLLDMFSLAYESVAEEMKQNLRFEEKQTKWKVIEQPLKELHRIFKEGEIYVKQCLELRDWWAQAITLCQNKDCIELYIHNLLCCIPVVIEAIEVAGEESGTDPDEIQKRRCLYSMKYQKECKDPKLFQWRFGKQYLVSHDICNRLDSVWEEDRWILLNKILRGKNPRRKQDQQLNGVLLKNLNESELSNGKLLPCSILVGSKDYHVRRRLGNGSQYKEIQWRGEGFVLRHYVADIEALIPEITRGLSLSHPNIMQFFCAFADEDKKECYLVMELMSRDLCTYIKEICGTKKRVPFSLMVAVDIMIQIARGMEYLHSKGIYHGELNPSNILLKARNVSTDGYVHAKVSGFGLSSSISLTKSSNQYETNSYIWYAPEVLAEQEQSSNTGNCKLAEKSDVYSFGMICFQLLTGKVPFEDSHLQGDKNISRNIRAGERPLFPFHSPKYLTNLTKRCWHADPNQRPSFSSICRILRYIKRFLLLNLDHNSQDAPMPTIDYCETEAKLLKNFPSWGSYDIFPLSQIPFQMFAYRVVEKERSNTRERENSETGSDEGSAHYGDEHVNVDEPISERKSFPPENSPRKSLSSLRSPDGDNSNSEKKSFPHPEMRPRRSMSVKRLTDLESSHCPEMLPKRSMSLKRLTDVKAIKQLPDVKAIKQTAGTPKGRSRPPPLSSWGNMRMNSESQLTLYSPKNQKKRSTGHVSDSDIP